MTAWISSVHCDFRVCCYSHILSDDSVLTEPELTEPGCVWCHVTPGLECNVTTDTHSLSSRGNISDRRKMKNYLFRPNSGEDYTEFFLGALVE